MSLHIGIKQEFSLTTNQSVKEKNSKKPTNSNKIKRLKQAIDETPMSIGNWQFPNSTQYMFGNGFSIEMPIKPVFNQNKFNESKEKPLVGVLKHVSPRLRSLNLKKDDLVGFTENSEYEFVFDNERLYRVPDNSIAINYGTQENEIEYNPSWLQSST